MKKIFSLLAATLFSAALMAADFTPTSVYVAGDARLGPSIVASAMADGMRVARRIADELLGPEFA